MSDVIKQYEASCLYNQHGAEKRLRGHLAISPAGDLVELRPGAVRVAISLERGQYIEGLKPGWHLGSDADVQRKQDEERARAEAGLVQSGAAVATQKVAKVEKK